MPNILEVHGLCKTYPDFALRNVSFTVPEDCIVGFIGVNGAGKTTTIRSILGLAQRTSGSIRICGQDFSDDQRDSKDRLGVVMDENCFYDELTMAQMKSVIAPAYSKWDEKSYIGYMDCFSLNPNQKIGTLSKGMRMKFSLVLALSHGADLLIMDEPTGGLDPLIRSQLLEMMTGYMKEGGKGILFSTHITSDLDKVADLLILLHEGSVVFQEEKDHLLDSYRMIKGDPGALTEESKKLFLSLHLDDYSFTGITNQVIQAKATIDGILLERPTLEDLMLAHIEGGI